MVVLHNTKSEDMFLLRNHANLVVFFSVLISLSLYVLLVNLKLNIMSDYHYNVSNEKIKMHNNKKIKAEPSPAIRKLLYEKYGFDAELSDQISVNRSVPDVRSKLCQNMTDLAQLPKVSIIITFYNERLSVLLRTIYGIINRSPDELIQEIILVDDCSTYSELHSRLTDYLSINLPPERSKVHLIRLPQRRGVMVARMTGARAATKISEVLIFLDSHLEVNHNWLPPLLKPIAFDPKTCTCPSFDIISFKNFAYKKRKGFRGYFDWNLNIIPRKIYEDEEATPEDNWLDYILMGASIAINAEFFWDLGGFDEGMTMLGGEQLELSFKIWMCDGEIVQVPCSRMAHLYRDPNFKVYPNLYGSYSFLFRNLRRLVDVWMDDEHRQYVFNRRPEVEDADPGDLTERHAIRDRLYCRNFSWMMENVMSDLKKFYPIK